MSETYQDRGGTGFGCLGAILGFVLGVFHLILTLSLTETDFWILLFSLALYVFYMVLLYQLLQRSKPAAATGLVVGGALILLLGVSCAGILRRL